MNIFERTAAGAAIALLTITAPVAAQQDTSELARVKRQLEALSAQIEALQLGQDVTAQADSAAWGLGPAAAKIYRTNRGVSLGGYGEFLYENYADTRENDSARPLATRDQLDALRAILYVGYKFSDKFLLNTELEFEHASTGQGGEVAVEFAYLDYLAHEHLGLRAGMVLVPMGFVNELHEPTVFLGSTRPLTENVIIPTTWRENGFGIFGEAGDFSYRAYLVNGLDAVGNGSSKAGGFGAGGLRGGRQKGARAIMEKPALVGRVDFAPAQLAGVQLGGSFYRGDSGNGFLRAAGADTTEIEVPTTILEGHAQLNVFGFEGRALYARATLDGVAALNAARGLTGNASIGEELTGWYAQLGYDVLRPLGTTQRLLPYVRYERVDTQASVPAGFDVNLANDRTITVLGAQYQPITQIVVKADYQIQKNEAKTGLNQLNVALGYIF